MKVETTALAINHIAQMYCVNGKRYSELYRNKLSGYGDWVMNEMSNDFYINPENIGPYMSLDETCLSNGEVWTFLTNKEAKGGKGTLAAAIPGTKSDNIICCLKNALYKDQRSKVIEVTCDLSPSMMLIASEVFTHADIVNDRFHVQQVYNEAVDEIRIDIRRDWIEFENGHPSHKTKFTYSNGETLRQILARSKHALMMSSNKWTDVQRHRVNILFKHYPKLKQAYEYAMELRQIFNKKISKAEARTLLEDWYGRVGKLANEHFQSVVKTFKNNMETIVNYFLRRATNASAEAFNSKVKIFRAQMRGVRDTKFFLFRLAKLYA